MSVQTWNLYVTLVKRMFGLLWSEKGIRLSSWNRDDHARPPHGCALPVARSASPGSMGVVYFTGATPDVSCKPFVLVATPSASCEQLVQISGSHGMCRALWTCETQRHSYDFAVKCALVLLAELGGAKLLDCDGCVDSNTWWDAIDWLSAQGSLPNAYPVAEADILLYAYSDLIEKSPKKYLHAAMVRRSDRLLKWMLSGSNNLPDEFAEFRIKGLRVLRALARARERRLTKVCAWVPRLVMLLNCVGDESRCFVLLLLQRRCEPCTLYGTAALRRPDHPSARRVPWRVCGTSRCGEPCGRLTWSMQ
jgi:hypothetical protein